MSEHQNVKNLITSRVSRCPRCISALKLVSDPGPVCRTEVPTCEPAADQSQRPLVSDTFNPLMTLLQAAEQELCDFIRKVWTPEGEGAALPG